VDLVDQRDAAVLAGFDGREVRRHQRVLLGQRAAVEGAGGVDHVDDAVAHRVGLLEHADGLGAAAHVDLDHALARRVDLVDEAQEALV
jgi:diphthamide biosynthesis methyltransferase